MSASQSPSFQRDYAATLAARLREPRRFLHVVAGPRQVGKTTLVHQVLAEFDEVFKPKRTLLVGGGGIPVRSSCRGRWQTGCNPEIIKMNQKHEKLKTLLKELFQLDRPNIVVCMLTTQPATAVTSTDYVLQDWVAAGLHTPSALCAYVGMTLAAKAQVIGHLSDRDWQQVQASLKLALTLGS